MKIQLRKYTLFILLISFSLLSGAQKVNNFKAKDLNFQTKSFNDLKGSKLTIIDFWATWCKPCIQAIPKLSFLYEQYKSNGLEIIGINTDSPRNSAKVSSFVKIHKMKYSVLRDSDSKLARSLNVSAFPTLFIVNSENVIVYMHIGFKIGDEKIIEGEIKKLLNES